MTGDAALTPSRAAGNWVHTAAGWSWVRVQMSPTRYPADASAALEAVFLPEVR